MLSYSVYKFVHLIGLASIFFALGAFSQRSDSNPSPKWVSIAHGVGLFLALLGGFGMAARLKLDLTQPWVLFKVFVWLSIGAYIAIHKRKPELASKVRLGVLLLAAVAGYLGIFHG